jgi:16S rRNA C967 or C1407 C5-methylase (RsmB/RsmF family)
MPTKAELKRSTQAATAFHNFYSSIWGAERWEGTLLPALLAPTHHAVLPNTFADDPSVAEHLNGTPVSTLPCLQTDNDIFVPPRKTPSGLLSHYNLDAASVLAVKLLDVQPEHHVLDLCAAPGGKSVCIAQHRPAALHSNELDTSRNKRLAANLKAYLPPDFNMKVLKLDGTDKRASFPLREYDRILVDAPCSSERHILHKHAAKSTAEEMMNWKGSHTKTLAKTQVALLLAALRLLKPGGRIVYATCSLSTEENDGVIERCQQKVNFEISEDDARDAMSEKTRFGRIVLPDHNNGGRWGPLYFCVITKPAT